MMAEEFLFASAGSQPLVEFWYIFIGMFVHVWYIFMFDIFSLGCLHNVQCTCTWAILMSVNTQFLVCTYFSIKRHVLAIMVIFWFILMYKRTYMFLAIMYMLLVYIFVWKYMLLLMEEAFPPTSLWAWFTH